jgi:hypothetical protein
MLAVITAIWTIDLTIVCLSATKFKSSVFSMTGLASANVANNDIVMIAYNTHFLHR